MNIFGRRPTLYSFQEFRCNKCPGFFVVRLNTNITGKILMVCPTCGRKHQRDVINGVIKDIGKDNDESGMEEIHVPKAAFSETAKTKVLAHAHGHLAQYHSKNRNGVVIEKPDDLVDPAQFHRWSEP